MKCTILADFYNAHKIADLLLIYREIRVLPGYQVYLGFLEKTELQGKR